MWSEVPRYKITLDILNFVNMEVRLLTLESQTKKKLYVSPMSKIEFKTMITC